MQIFINKLNVYIFKFIFAYIILHTYNNHNKIDM